MSLFALALSKLGRRAARLRGRETTIRRLLLEIERLEHIVGILTTSIRRSNHTAKTVEEHVRVHDGRIQVWSFGEWLDLREEQAKAEEV